jgi:hypothetical protein
MTGGSPLSAAAGAGGRSGLAARRKLGRLGRATELGCDTVNQAEEKEVRRQTSRCWAASKHGPEERKVEGKEKKGLNNF